MEQILSCCVSQLQQVMLAANMPFAQRMCSFPLVLRHFAFFHNSEAYYQMGLLNVLDPLLHPQEQQWPLALVVRRTFPFF